jgi:kanamycin kinase
MKINDMNVMKLDANSLPDEISPYIAGSRTFDYSFSERAKTYFLDRDGGYFLKTGPKKSLNQQALMMRHLHKLGFTSRMLRYISCDEDFLLMEKVEGEPCVESKYLARPKLLAKAIGESLRKLHDSPTEGCPIKGVTSSLIPLAHAGYKSGRHDPWMIAAAGFSGPEDAYEFLTGNEDKLVEDSNIHGDACLPNILLNDFEFSGFIDFEGGGLGDRHFDLLWAIWSLEYNLKTADYKELFLNSYGLDAFDIERYKLCCVIQGFSRD